MSRKPSSKSLRRTCLERDNYTCKVCGLHEPEIMHVDHIEPRWATDEYDSLSNMVTLCPNDHARKTSADRKKYGHPVWNRGVKLSEEQKSKLDMSGLAAGRTWAMGRKFTAEHVDNLKKARAGKYAKYWSGKTFSIEHRQKLSVARKGKKPWNAGLKQAV